MQSIPSMRSIFPCVSSWDPVKNLVLVNIDQSDIF